MPWLRGALVCGVKNGVHACFVAECAPLSTPGCQDFVAVKIVDLCCVLALCSSLRGDDSSAKALSKLLKMNCFRALQAQEQLCYVIFITYLRFAPLLGQEFIILRENDLGVVGHMFQFTWPKS